ncbi:VIT1/CCC1 transporter family protein [Cucumibacter marinus]|uniref:VIT1/CCC1 transporter family protein n=1 Tax=Cucumibacter marinus TaxID=1121252 RepID=UPI000401A38E|nr:VIT1/CCC1 transporter family protein [Cucumibacter marinus]
MSEIDHSDAPNDVAARLHKAPSVNYLRDWIYGGIDGAVTTFAVVAGVIGANLSTSVILVLGLANLIADGFSMAASNYSGTKAERDDYERIRQIELRRLRDNREHEREKLRRIYREKGYEGEQLDTMVDIISSRDEVMLDTMLHEEYGLTSVQRSPGLAALATFLAFIICGAVPLLPFAFDLAQSPLIASTMTGVVFFAIGTVKSRWSTQHWSTSGFETLVIGLGAAGLAFLIGAGLQGLVGASGI